MAMGDWNIVEHVGAGYERFIVTVFVFTIELS